MRNAGNYHGRDGVRLQFWQGLQQSKTAFTAENAEKNQFLKVFLIANWNKRRSG